MTFLVEYRPSSVNVAGNRESRSPGIEKAVCKVLHSAFTACMHDASGRMLTAQPDRDNQIQKAQSDMNNQFGSNPFQTIVQTSAPTAQVQPGAAAPAPMLSQVMPAQAMGGYNPFDAFADAKIKNKGKNYLHQGLYLLQVEQARIKMCDGVQRWIINGTVVCAVDSVSHVNGGTWGWAPAMDKYGIDDIWTCCVALLLGLHPVKDKSQIEQISREQRVQITGSTIATRADGQPALSGRLLAARCVDGQNAKSGAKYTDNHWRPVLPEHGQAAQAAGGWTPEIVRQMAMS